jgi:peptide/nickel transport system permease protein
LEGAICVTIEANKEANATSPLSTEAVSLDPAPILSNPQRGRLAWLKQIGRKPKAIVGATVIGLFVVVALLAPLLAPGDPLDFVDRANLPPSWEHWFGTTGQGQDVFHQIIWGTRVSLGIGFVTGLLATLVGVFVGMTAGYFGGWIDDLLSLLMNIFLIVPSLPLLVIITAFLPPSPVTIMFVLVFTGWAWPARVLRSQTLSLREKDFVAAALVSGESSLYIIFREILPNMASIVVGSFFDSTIYAIGAEAGLEFLGLGNVGDTISWGTILFWAQNNAGLLTGAWWTFVPAGLCIALIAFSFAMLNYSVDEITNPRLRVEKEIVNVFKKLPARFQRTTAVIRSSTDE